MRRVVLAVLVLCALGLTWAIRARAQSVASPRTASEYQLVSVGDGGTLPITLGGERVAAEVTGLSGGAVVVSGTVGLNAFSLASIAGPTCVPSDIRRIAVTATPIVIPVISASRTEVTIHNVSNGAISLSCRPDISGLGDLPDCATPGYGITISRASSVTFAFRSSVTIRCRTCPNGNGTIEHLEVSCTG